MSVDNVKPALAQPEPTPGKLTLRLNDDGVTTRVWLRANVLGGTAGSWHDVDATHPELLILAARNIVGIPDENDEIQPPPPVRKGGCGCR